MAFVTSEPKPYVFQSYPQWIHIEGQKSVLVDDEQAHLAYLETLEPVKGSQTVKK
jgi:hypothetical protein